MGISGINSVNNYNGYNRIQKKSAVDKANAADTVSISQEAKDKAELQRIIDMVKSAPDVRADRVAEVTDKLKDPNYINNTILGNVADKILDVFGI